MNIRALLRKQKLWKYTQEEPPVTLTVAALTKWKESSQEAADVMTPTVSDPVKALLTALEFDCKFLIWARLATHFQPKGDGEFIRLTKEYYTLKLTDFETISAYLTHIKQLEERIAATKVVLTPDKQTILCLAISLTDDLQYLTKIWDLTPDMTADKARTMLLEEERKRGNREPEERFALASFGKKTEAIGKPPCKTCGKLRGPVCWDENPDLAPDGWRRRDNRVVRSGSAMISLVRHMCRWHTVSEYGGLVAPVGVCYVRKMCCPGRVLPRKGVVLRSRGVLHQNGVLSGQECLNSYMFWWTDMLGCRGVLEFGPQAFPAT